MLHMSLRQPAAFLATALATASLTGGALARPQDMRSRPVAVASPFIGEWELDLSRMPSTYGPPPKRVLYRFQDIGEGKWRLTVEITGRDNGVRHMAASFRPDGTAVPSEGETSEADYAAVMTPTPSILVLNLARAKMLGSVRIYIVSPGGTEMTESAAGLNGEGQPFVRNFHYKRLR